MSKNSAGNKISNHQKKLDQVLAVKTIKLFDKKGEKNKNPVVRAHHVWSIISDQLKDILGDEIYNQWFKSLRAMVISDNVLILEAESNIGAFWINKHYQKLVDLLLQFIDPKLSSFFLAPADQRSTSKSTTTEIDSCSKN